MSAKTPLEIPVFTAAAAIQAQDLGARRIELNATGSYSKGGLTPSLEELEAISAIDIPVMIMIRPRGPLEDGADFVYTNDEFEDMKASVEEFVNSGYLEAADGDGFVFGVLRKGDDGVEVDVERNAALVEAAAGHPCTFHRAFDELLAGAAGQDAEKVAKAVKDVAACGFSAVLTSGGPGKAADNAAVLAVVGESARGKFEVIVGGGVRSGNVKGILDILRGKEVTDIWAHSSCLAAGEGNLDLAEVGGLISQL